MALATGPLTHGPVIAMTTTTGVRRFSAFSLQPKVISTRRSLLCKAEGDEQQPTPRQEVSKTPFFGCCIESHDLYRMSQVRFKNLI